MLRLVTTAGRALRRRDATWLGGAMTSGRPESLAHRVQLTKTTAARAHDGFSVYPRVRVLTVRCDSVDVGVAVASMTRTAAKPPRHPSVVVDGGVFEAARRGEAWARRELMVQHAPMMTRLAYHLLGRDADVDDLVQDTFVKALTALNTLKDPEAFRPWITQIVVRGASHIIRHRRLRRRLGLAQEQLQPIEEHINGVIAPGAPPAVIIELRRIYRLIDALPARLRIVLILRRVEGMPLDEIARVTGASLSTVKRRISDADAALANAKEGKER